MKQIYPKVLMYDDSLEMALVETEKDVVWIPYNELIFVEVDVDPVNL